MDQQNRIKLKKKKNLRLLVGAPLGRVPAGSPTPSPMELRHCLGVLTLHDVTGYNKLMIETRAMIFGYCVLNTDHF